MPYTHLAPDRATNTYHRKDLIILTACSFWSALANSSITLHLPASASSSPYT